MSLRLSSLDPSELRANKECRNCNRRRIRCDKSLPTCKKCALRGLDCSGYGLRIQWNQGVASRGKLRGKFFPVNLDEALPSSSLKRMAGIPLNTPITSAGTLRPQLDRSQENEFALNLDLSTQKLPEDLINESALGLLRYYDHVVAALMPWVDDAGNEWRILLIPLALQRSSLLSAILALAAEHCSSRIGAETSNQSSVGSDHYRDKALRLVAQDLHEEMAENIIHSRPDRAAGILSTILILCQLEMVRLDASLWRVHWTAVRTITQRWTATQSSPTSLDETCRFLIKEAFVYDVFGSSTAFDGGHISGDTVRNDDVDIFIDYLRLLQRVTQLERSLHGDLRDVEVETALSDMRSLYEAFAETRDRNFELASKMALPSQEARDNLNLVFEIFHHTGLVYSFQALVDPVESTPARQCHVRAATDYLNQIHNGSCIQHDLVWPLFIIGTEARGSLKSQKHTEQSLQDIMKATGFRNCQPALDFLRRFWAIDYNVAPNWIAYARQEFQNGLSFLVI